MRYFAHLAYNGASYFGWQRQPNQISVQQKLEEAFSTILNRPIPVTGCGRTDTGVHAGKYYLHFDHEGEFPKGFLNRINKFLPRDIVIYDIIPVKLSAHARFDAYSRSYTYRISFDKDPFSIDTTYHFPFAERLSIEKLQEAAALLLEYDAFFPFCKSDNDTKTMNCSLENTYWEFDTEKRLLLFHISANRFLRGMVRLIVGMCLNVGLGKIQIHEVRRALERQTRLENALSVAPQGLFLTDVKYPETIFKTEALSSEYRRK